MDLSNFTIAEALEAELRGRLAGATTHLEAAMAGVLEDLQQRFPQHKLSPSSGTAKSGTRFYIIEADKEIINSRGQLDVSAWATAKTALCWGSPRESPKTLKARFHLPFYVLEGSEPDHQLYDGMVLLPTTAHVIWKQDCLEVAMLTELRVPVAHEDAEDVEAALADVQMDLRTSTVAVFRFEDHDCLDHLYRKIGELVHLCEKPSS